MSKYKIPGLMLALVIALGVAGIGVNALHAAGTSGPFHPMENLVNAIAEKFNLNPADVQAVFDTEKIKADAEREASYESRISSAVSSGDLTQTQADLIIAKHKEIEANKPDFQNLNKEEIRNNLKTQMDSLKSWAETNNIPLQYLYFGPGGHMKGVGEMMRMGMHNDNDDDDR